MMAEECRNERTAASGAAADNLPFAAVKTLSVNELRTAVEAHLKQCGALNRLKTELRGMMLEGVLKETKMKRAKEKQPSSSCNAVGANGATSKLPTSSSTASKQYDSLENFEKMRSIFATQDARSANELNELTTDHLVATLPLPEHQTQKEASVQEQKQSLEEEEEYKEEEEEEQWQQETHFAFQKWCAHVADALVAHHLRITERQLTYSLFVNEAVVLPLTDCGVREEEDEVLRKMLLVHSTSSSSSLTSSHHGTSAGNANVANICENDDDDGKIYRQIRMRNASRYSVLQSLIECNLLLQRHISSSGSKTRMTCTNRTAGTQTEHGEFATEVFGGDRHKEVNDHFSDFKNDNRGASKRNGYAPLTTLEARLAAVDVKHALEMSHIQRSRHLFNVASIRNHDGRECRENSDLYCYTPSATPLSFQLAVERRLETYKQEMHAQLRKEYEMKRERFERETLEHAKQEAAENFAVRISNMTEAMAEQKRALEVKLANERQALTTLKESLEAERNQLLKSQRAMAEERMQHDEVNAFQLIKLRENNEKLLLMQVKCAKWEELASSRLVEVNQLKRKVESLSSHIERMYAEYAQESDAKNDEIARLQFKLRMLLSEHIGGNRHDDYSTTKNKEHKSEDIIDKKTIYNHKINNTSNKINSDNKENNAKRNVEKVISSWELDSDMHAGKQENNNNSSIASDTVKKGKEEHNTNHNIEQEECECIKNGHKEINKNDHVRHGNALPSTLPAVNATAHNDEPTGERVNINHYKNSSNLVEDVQVYDQRASVELPTEEELEHKNEPERAGTSKKLETQEHESTNTSYTSSESITTTTITTTQSSKHSSGDVTNKEEVHRNVPSSSSSTTTSTTSRSIEEKDDSKSESVRAKEIAEKNVLEQINTQINDMINMEEVDERRALLQEEQQVWSGIAWTHKSQLSLITEREKNTSATRERNDTEYNVHNDNTANKDSDSDDEVAAASPISLFARMQRAEAAQERKIVSSAHNVDQYVNHSDDTDEFSDDEADELLFAKKSTSSSSSF